MSCTPVRCTPLRCTPVICTFMWYTPLRCTPVRYPLHDTSCILRRSLDGKDSRKFRELFRQIDLKLAEHQKLWAEFILAAT